jgi:hypothetical protein
MTDFVPSSTKTYPILFTRETLDYLEDRMDAGGSNPMISFGGQDPANPPNVIGPSYVLSGVGGTYADSGTGNIYQFTSYAENTGTRPTVGVFGFGKAKGSGSKAWGGNFAAYASHATAGSVIALEINGGRLVAGSGAAYGIVVSNYGGNGMTNHIQLQTGAASSVATDGIVFESGTGFEPVSGRLIRTSGVCNATHGIDFSSGVFSTYGITIGTNALLAGLVTSAKATDVAQVLAELENLSTNSNTTKGAVLSFVGRDTVNSRKAVCYIQSLPQDANWQGGDLSFHTRISNTVAERMRLSSTSLVLNSLYMDWDEIAAPTNPGVNKARLFSRDNGSGKTQLCVIFNTGVVIPLATEA